MSDNIYTKLLAVQTELKAPKNQYNSFGKYKYRSCEDILEAVKPLLKKYGISMRICNNIETHGNRIYVRSDVVLRNIDVSDDQVIDQHNIISTNAYAREPESRKGMDDSQITGSCISYANKYALSNLFLLDDTKDADHDKISQNAVNDEINELIIEMRGCTSIKELEAHYKANESFVKEHGLIDYYAKKRKMLS